MTSTIDTFLTSGKIHLASVGIGTTTPQYSLHLHGEKHIDTRGTWQQYSGDMIGSTMGVGIGTTTTYPLNVQSNLSVSSLSLDTVTASNAQWTTGYINNLNHIIDSVSIPGANIPYIAKQIISYQQNSAQVVIQAMNITLPRGYYTFRYDGAFYVPLSSTVGARYMRIEYSTNGGVTYTSLFSVWHDVNVLNHHYSISGTATIYFADVSITVTHWRIAVDPLAQINSTCYHHLSVQALNNYAV